MERLFDSNHRGALLCILPALAATVLLGIAACFCSLPENVHIPATQTFPTLLGQQPAAPTPEAGSTDPVTSAVNILLIGQDSTENETQSRSDSIILCTFHKESRTLTMTSILRDLYVQIPGYRNNRINAAYSMGGRKLLQKTLEENFGITVDGCIEVDFTRFPRLIDSLGGVTLELRADEAEAINERFPSDLQAGTCLLSGDQALTYVRIRKLDKDGDFSRTARQRKLLQALLDAYRNAGITRILTTLDEVLPMVTTDMDKSSILTLARQMVPLLSELQIRQQHIPQEGTYVYKTIRGMSVLVADLDAARELLAQAGQTGSK